MSSYSVYDPNARDDALQRLMDLSAARKSFNDKMFARAEEERLKQQNLAENQQKNNLGSAWGMLGTGAALGTMFAPGIGTAIGAGAGLLLGGAMEMHNRKDYAKAMGEKGYSTGDAFKNTFGRAPTMAEIPALVGGVSAVGGIVAHAGAQQMNQQEQIRNWSASANMANTAGGYMPGSGQYADSLNPVGAPQVPMGHGPSMDYSGGPQMNGVGSQLTPPANPAYPSLQPTYDASQWDVLNDQPRRR